jgi:uncharacterized membrane protein
MLESWIVEFLNGLPPQFVVMFIGALPVSELRGAIPVAIGIYGMTPGEAYLISVIGNLLPIPILLQFLGDAERILRRLRPFDIFFEWLFARTRRRTGEKIKKYGALGLIPFVAIPLPVTGAWTGVAAAYVFDIKFRYAFPAIFLGVLIAGIVVLTAALGISYSGLFSL